jgi:hypothetical protein
MLKKISNPVKKWANELNRHFSKEKVQTASKNMKKCSKFLAIKEMQIETTLRFHFTPIRTAVTKNTNNNKFGEDAGEKGILYEHCWWQCKLVQYYGKQYGGSLKN